MGFTATQRRGRFEYAVSLFAIKNKSETTNFGLTTFGCACSHRKVTERRSSRIRCSHRALLHILCGIFRRRVFCPSVDKFAPWTARSRPWPTLPTARCSSGAAVKSHSVRWRTICCPHRESISSRVLPPLRPQATCFSRMRAGNTNAASSVLCPC